MSKPRKMSIAFAELSRSANRLDLDVRVDVVQSFARRHCLPRADFRRAVQNLALQVAAIDDVEVRDSQRPHAGGGEIQSSGGTESAGADQQERARRQASIGLRDRHLEGEVCRE